MISQFTAYRTLARQIIENNWVAEFVRRFPPNGSYQRHPQFVERTNYVLDRATGAFSAAQSLHDVGTGIGISKERVRQILVQGLDMGARIRSEHVHSIEDIIALIRQNDYMMRVLRVARAYNLPDWMIGPEFSWNFIGGMLGSTAWPHDVPPFTSIDLMYYDPTGTDATWERTHEARLCGRLPLPWSVMNQARAYAVSCGRAYRSGRAYKSSVHALSLCETMRCVALRLSTHDQLRIITPLGAHHAIERARWDADPSILLVL